MSDVAGRPLMIQYGRPAPTARSEQPDALTEAEPEREREGERERERENTR